MPDFTSPELPVEDALEQGQDTVEDDGVDGAPAVAVTFDASDADLLEQSREVPLDDDDHDR